MAGKPLVPQWLKSTRVTGLDQLGIQVVSIALYSDLLPGLTNVTDRIRYYSFYPWLLHRYATDVKVHDETTWQEHLRRAEFLLALIGRFHHRDSREGGEALVGADLANVALAEIAAKPRKTWRLSQWSAVANAGQKGSYFKNKNGGFGQYYRVQLASLGLLSFSDDSIGVKLTKGRGTTIARICDAQKGRPVFWKAVRDDKITLERIAAIAECLCPCAVVHHDEEREFLTEMLFGPDAQDLDGRFSRAESLRLLLAVLNHAKQPDSPVEHFRTVAYYHHDATARRFRPPTELAEVFGKWSIYETCELVNYALEIAFDALLHHLAEADGLDTDANRFIYKTTTEAFGVTSSELGLGTRRASWCKRTLGDILEEAQKRQLPLSDWHDDPWSEDNLIFELEDQPPLSRLARAFACLVAICARDRIPIHPFEAFPTVTPDWLSRHRVTLRTVSDRLTNRKNENAAKVFADLLQDFVVGQHLRVAMRKLKSVSQSTFKIAVEEGRFVWLENFEPTRTNPRLRQAFRFLRDLGFCFGESGGWKLSPQGKQRLRHVDVN
jgi:hypothetical protein